MDCPHCPAVLPAAQLARHRERFHQSEPHWLCAACQLTSTHFPDALAHCILTAHPLRGLRRQAPEQPQEEAPTLPREDHPENEIATAQETDVKLVEPWNHKEVEAWNRWESVRVQTLEDAALPKERMATCRRCAKVVSLKSSAWAARHALACLNIRPFCCGGCGRRGARRNYLAEHQARTRACLGSGIQLPERAADEEKVMRGLMECFGRQFSFKL